MIQIKELSKSYGDRTLFDCVTLSIGDGERCAVAGRNGSGKSTLLKILSGMEEHDGGEVIFPKGLRIGALPQHLHFDQETLLDEAVMGLPEELRDEAYRVEIILGGLGFLEEDFSRPPSSFSGGYQLRLALAKVLAGEPELLLLDEPTNYLDILAIRWLEKFLQRWRGQVLFISHDRSFVNRVSTHVIGIKRSKMKKIRGNLDNYDRMVALEEETHERAREKQEKKKAHMLSFVERFGAKATKAGQAQSRLKAIEKMDSLEALEEEQSLLFQFNYQKIHNPVMIRAQGLTFSYQEEELLIDDLELNLENGDRLAVVGKNGSGKSTIVRLLAGELSPNGGEIKIAPNVEMAYFGQTNIERLNPGHTIEEELVHAFPEASYAEVRAACGAMLFSGDDAKKPISVLSGGEKSRVLLAKLLLKPANLLLLDEPTHHLDVESVDALIYAIQQFRGTVVLVSHDEDVLENFKAHKLIICHQDAQEVFLGTYPEFLEKRGWEEESDQSGKKSQKEKRRDRANRTQERAKELQPIKKEIAQVERRIEKLEDEKRVLETKMAADPEEGIQEKMIAHAEIEKEVDVLYKRLQELYRQEEEIIGQRRE